ncbi:MAG TPA: beta-ketoacyl synthase N-terminal-like domain-containing protein, partial [Myxococcota bacterium]|nr:beta-ketoacyl synthase N-terminal-like domain-containing protein [Myxococcota bacterium]
MSKPFAPIAVVGAGAIFPGSTDVAGYWQNILAGKDLLTDVPASHWLTSDYYDADPKAPDRTYAKRGAFLPTVAFDPLAYGIPPSLLPATDTSQLLALIVAQQ